MPVRINTIERFGKPFSLFQSDITVEKAFQEEGIFLEKKLDTYILIPTHDSRYKVGTFAFFLTFLRHTGVNGLNFHLCDLPFTDVSRVVSKDCEESGLLIVEWVSANPGSSVVVIDEDHHVLGLFINQARTGEDSLFSSVSFSSLGGSVQDFINDIRARIHPRITGDACEHCGHVGFLKFVPADRTYRCECCNEAQKVP